MTTQPLIAAENVHNPAKLDGAGHPELIVGAGERIKLRHHRVMYEAGIEEIKIRTPDGTTCWRL